MVHVLAFEKPIVDLVTRIRELRKLAGTDDRFTGELRRLEEKAALLAREVFQNLSAHQKVQLSRHPNRPYTSDYLGRLFTDFIELHGDRRYADDAAIITGLAKFHGRSVAIIGHQKGRSPRRTSSGASARPTPRGIGRPSASTSSPIASGSRS